MQSLLALHPPLATLDPPSGRVSRPVSRAKKASMCEEELSHRDVGKDKVNAQRLIDL